jgi:quinol monooxygenase YgiN
LSEVRPAQAYTFLTADRRPPACRALRLQLPAKHRQKTSKNQQSDPLPSSHIRSRVMVKLALYVHLEAKPGKEKDVEAFLLSGLPLVEEEPATIAWFALKMGPSTFGIFDAFPDEAGRDAHLNGKVAAALMAKAGELLATPPSIQKVDLLAAKLPG